MTHTASPPDSTAELREEVERLRLLHSMSLEFSATLDFDQLLPRIFERVLAVLGAEGGSIWIAEGDLLCCRLAQGGGGQKLVGARMPIGSGFVGDVAQRPRTTIVTRAVEDPRYQPQVDSGEMLALTVMATAMVAGGATVGAIQVSNKLTGDGIFDQRDRELLEGLAASAAASLRNAQLHSVEKRARDLALLLEISREITATLDLDRVLRSVVNLASRALDFDRGAVGLYQKGQCEIRAVAGQETVDPKDPALQDLIARAAWAAGHGAELYLTDRSAPTSDAERMFVSIFGADLERDDVSSGLYLPLRDEEGVLGVLVLEAAQPELASPVQLELAGILANQTAVALRNAQLYHQVPMVDALGALAAKKRALLAVPRRKLLLATGIGLAVLAALCLLRWPLRVTGTDAVFRPLALTPVRALVPGVVERVLVREGAAVTKGMPLMTLRATQLLSDRAATAAAVDEADRSAALAASRSDPAEERLQRIRSDGLRQELALIDEEVGLTTVRAPMDGVVLTPHPAEKLGTSVDEGDLLLSLGRTDTLEVEFGVDQRDIGRIRQGQDTHLRVDALPQHTFTGPVSSIGELPFDSGPVVRYPVRAYVANPDGLLKPLTPAYARVLTEPTSAFSRLVRGPARWARLAWWKVQP
ncbi:MAG TPA: GAF domain-containing protein [Gemmatimonadales bacterium]